MDTLANLRAFMSVARSGSFAAAARDLGVAPSVVTKRVNQAEHQLKGRLFERTTRRVTLTPTGLQHLPAVQRLLADLDTLITGVREVAPQLQGRVRIKVPTSLAVLHVGPALDRFQQAYPLVSLEVIALDRPVNPVDEGFDVALTLMPQSYGGVTEVPLCAMPRWLCASPHYLAHKGRPRHPRDLADHDLLNFLPTGSSWTFRTATGDASVPVHARLATNEAQLLLSSAMAGNGIAVAAAYLAAPALASGQLVRVLDDYPMEDLWLKALVPDNRLGVARVEALLSWLRRETAPPTTPPSTAG